MSDTPETVATFGHRGATYEIDHLGITHPDTQWGEYVVYTADGRQVGEFISRGAGLYPQYRPPEPSVPELVELAKAALEEAGR
ncbi:hypothetical protein [Nocardiopsis composta]|uniref:Uncharacterized protein n=1 Tax=Nocardiopsis composta TaxID=157465 RepID=A0A7W8QJ10_9ACTN|nr:hypothetical protein [Nocardiopsis composta]MBB5431383.1 hypothetical protein [Nocardiopsis composta]